LDGGDSNDTENKECVLGDLSGVCGGLAADGVLRVTDADNYDFGSTLTISHTVVKGNSDLTIDWSQLTMDLLGRPINPASDIDLVLISLWSMSQADLADQINNDTLLMSDNTGAVWVYTEGVKTSANLFSFGIMGDPTEPSELLKYFNSANPEYDPTTWTHMIMAQSGETPGSNARMLAFFTLSEETENTTITLTPDSSSLAYQVNMRNQNWLPVAPGNPNLAVDWENMNVNSMGNEFVYTKIGRVVVAHYSTMNTCDLENNFLRLQEMADGWYEKQLTEVALSTTLSDLTDVNMNPFLGIDNTGAWIIALFCNDCANPAPWFLSVLYPCG
jgi:hypothetical protein